MRFDLLIDGKVNRVELGIGKVVTVKLGSEIFQAEVTKSKEGMSVLLDGQEFQVQIDGSRVSIDGREHRIEVRNLRRGRPSWSHTIEQTKDRNIGTSLGKIAMKEEMIFAPMPGSVISIRVEKGDSVKVGSPILVLEAMKMQNEILSTVDGIVREIRVSEGNLVESGDVLVVIGD